MDIEAARKLIHGVSFASQLAPTEPPLITCIAGPKTGKSCLVPTLFDWPNDGDRPLILAFDRTGPDAIAQLGYAASVIKIEDLPGDSLLSKSRNCLVNLEDIYITKKQKPFSSIVVDCGSTQAERHWAANRGITNTLQRYGKVLEACTEFLDRLLELGVPIIYLGWLTKPWVEESGSKQEGTYKREQHKGGLNIRGGFRDALAGRSMMIFFLEKTKPAPAVTDRDADGFKRVFHTREYRDIECGGRYKLPEPMDANLGYALAMIMGQVENPALAGLELKR